MVVWDITSVFHGVAHSSDSDVSLPILFKISCLRGSVHLFHGSNS